MPCLSEGAVTLKDMPKVNILEVFQGNYHIRINNHGPSLSRPKHPEKKSRLNGGTAYFPY